MPLSQPSSLSNEITIIITDGFGDPSSAGKSSSEIVQRGFTGQRCGCREIYIFFTQHLPKWQPPRQKEEKRDNSVCPSEVPREVRAVLGSGILLIFWQSILMSGNLGCQRFIR